MSLPKFNGGPKELSTPYFGDTYSTYLPEHDQESEYRVEKSNHE